MLTRSDLHDYQREAVDFIVDRDRCAAWLALGLGKTIITLTAVADWLDACIAGRVLVVAPLRVARNVWAQEAAAWAHTAHLDVAWMLGPPKGRLAALNGDAEVVVVNRENVPWLVKTLKEARRPWPFDTVVVDESSSFKSHRARRWKALKSALPFIDRIVLLTGTPAANGLTDLWAQQYLVDEGEALGKRITHFRERWFAPDFMGWNWDPRDGAADEIHERMKPTTLAMSAEGRVDVPERIDVTVGIELPPKLRKTYDDFKRSAVLDLDGEEIEALSAGVLAGKLLQFTAGACYRPDGGWLHIHDLKLDALAEVVDDNPTENLLVAYRYRSDLARLRERFPRASCVTEPGVIDAWNRGEVSMLLAHPASAGHGLNLQAGGSTLVWFGLDWSLEMYQQTIGRLHRQGQTRPVRVLHLVLRDTFDERVMAVLASKNVTQSALLTAIRQELK